MNDITQSRIDRARVEQGSRRRDDEGEYDDDYEDVDEEELSGAICFSRRVRKTVTPKGFKLHADKIKYEGVQEPEAWLNDYLQTIRVHGGTKTTVMQSKNWRIGLASGHDKGIFDNKCQESSIKNYANLVQNS
jgi:hypothetical protein